MTRLEVWVPGPITPVKNFRGHWRKRWRLARDWRDRTAERVRLEILGRRLPLDDWRAFQDRRKRVTFTLHVARLFDSDSVPSSVAPCRDALGDIGVIGAIQGITRPKQPGVVPRPYSIPADDPAAGHVWIYSQVVNRGERGVKILIEAIPAHRTVEVAGEI